MWPFLKKHNHLKPEQATAAPIGGRYPRSDSLQNLLTGLGTNRDKRAASYFGEVPTLTEIELNNIYRGEGLGWRIIDVLTEDIMRKQFTISGDPDNLLAKELRKIKFTRKFTDCVRWALLHGGSIGVIGIDDGGFLDEPVNKNDIQAVTHINVYDKWRVFWTSADLYTDPTNEKFGTPEWYTVFPINYGFALPNYQNLAQRLRNKGSLRNQYYSGMFEPTNGMFRVHESRVLRFDGKNIPQREKIKNYGWNDSYLQGVYERLKGLNESYAAIELILQEFMVGTLTIDNLANMIASGNESLAIKRLELLDRSRHILNTLLLDSKETYVRNFANLNGLPQAINCLVVGISGCSGIPVTRLFGQSPAGLNATGNNDMRMYYDKVDSMRQFILQEPIEKLVQYIMLSKSSGFKGKQVENWEVIFPPLYQLNELEQAQMQNTQADTDLKYINSGVLEPSEVALSRFGGNKYSIETNINKGIKRVRPEGQKQHKERSTEAREGQSLF